MKRLLLPDGRTLAYDDVGDPQGRPVFWHHGSMTCRLFRHPDDSLAARAGVRLICTDRPGYGESSPQPHRTLSGWARDVARLADELGLDRFSVAGASAGAPNTLAVAACLGARVDRVVLVSPLGPLDEPGALHDLDPALARPIRLRRHRRLLGLGMRPLARLARRDPSKFVDRWADSSSPPDRLVLTDPVFRDMMEEQSAEAFRHGPMGLVDELNAIYSWGFSPEDVGQHVEMLHGDADTFVSPDMARRLAGRLPDCHLELVPGAGHLLALPYWETVLARAVAPQGGAVPQ